MAGIIAGKQTRPFNNKLKVDTGIMNVSAIVAFLLLNAVKITLFNYFLIQKQTAGSFLYKLGMTLLLIIILYPLIYRLKSRAVSIAAYVLQSLYIFINIAYYLYFHSYLHIVQSLTLFTEAYSLASNFAIPLSTKMLIIFIDLPFFAFLIAGKSKMRSPGTGRKRNITMIAAIVSLLIVFSVETVNYNQNRSLVQIMHDTFSGESPIVERYGTLMNNIVNIYTGSSASMLANQLKYGGKQSNDVSAPEKPNFVIIQVESMDASVINQKYKDGYIAPYLHSLSGNSIYYPYMMSYHKGGGTSDSEFSILNSVEPLDSYPALKLSNYNYPNSLISRLDGASYETLAFHGNTGSFYNRDVAFPKLGFNEFYDMAAMNIPENGWGLPDNDVFNYAVNKLKIVAQPFFSYIITMTSHEPFNSARNYYNNSRYDDIKDETVKNYFNSISYVDMSIKNTVEKIETNFKNTYVIILGDHTPNINTGLYKQTSFTMDGKYFEFVPLLIITPDKKVYKEEKEAASFLDISPTVLRASGIAFNVLSDGQDLLEQGTAGGNIPYRGSSYDRKLLFAKAGRTGGG